MSQTIALLTDITSEGSVILTQQTGAKLNGMPIATRGSKITYKGSPTDQPIEFVSGVLLNGQPLTFVGAKTSSGATLMSTGKTTASIGKVERDTKEPQKSIEKKPRKIVLKSTYPYEELHKISKELSKSTFIMLLTSFFEDDIPWKAYENLYRRLRRKKIALMPPIVVVEEHLKGNKYAAFDSESGVIEIRRSCVIQAVEGNETEREEAKQLLLLALLEEYGHYIDYYLRNCISTVGGDAKRDEGAVFSYFLTNYWVTDEKIDFGTIEIDGVVTPLSLDFSKVVQDYNDLRDRIEKDLKEGSREYFSSGKKDSNHNRYGHFDFIKVLEKKKILNKYGVCWIYLGNYLRDMSQVISPMLIALSQEDRQIIEGVSKDYLKYKPEFLESFLLTQKTWANVIEVLAARTIITEIETELEKGDSEVPNFFEKILRPSAVGWSEENIVVFDNRSRIRKYRQILKNKTKDLGLDVIEYAGKYVHFIKYFDEVTPGLLGISRTEEHIDNPLTTFTFNQNTKDYFYCPPEAKPPLTEVYGMKRYIRNEISGIERGVDDQIKGAKGKGEYAAGLPTAVETMRKFFKEGVTTFKDRDKTNKDRLLGLTNIGAALHILEDYFAHSNFCEVLLIKLGVSAYPWVDVSDAELKNYNNSQKKFKVENVLSKDNSNNPNKADKISYFQNIDTLYTYWSREGDCILLPSFEVDGIYFLAKTKKEKRYKLYLANFKKEKPTTSKGNTEIKQKKIITIPDRNIRFSLEDLPLNIANAEKAPLKDCTSKREKVIRSYKGLRCHIVDDNIFNNEGSLYNHAQYIPIVTGFFATDDAVHSIVELLEESIKIEEVSLYTMIIGGGEGDKPVMLELADMIIIYILRELTLRQYEENGVAIDTGENTSSKFLELYIKYIEYRDTLNRLIDIYKKYRISRYMLYPLETIVEYIKKQVKNFIKKIVKNVLETLAKAIVFVQNANIDRIGTNPTHSQLAKDEPDHPLHSLAGTLARHCIAEMKDIFEALASAENKYKTKGMDEITLAPNDIAELFIEKALSFMQHPCQTDWADAIALEWLQATPEHLRALHKHEYLFRIAKDTGEETKRLLKELDKLVHSKQQLVDEVRGFIQKTTSKIDDFITKIDNLLKKLGKQVREEVERVKREVIEYKDEILRFIEMLYDYTISRNKRSTIKHQLELKIRGSNEKIDFILKEMTPYTHEEDFSPSLQGIQRAFCQKEIQKTYDEKYNSSSFQSKMYAYLKETDDKQYAKSIGGEEQYQQYCKSIFQKEQQYIAQSEDYYIKRLGKQNSLIVEPNEKIV